MLFNSGQFLLFFPAVILLYYIIPAKHSVARRVFLLAASYYFYMCWNARYGLLILGATAVEDMTAGEYDLTLYTCTYGGENRVALRCDRVRN